LLQLSFFLTFGSFAHEFTNYPPRYRNGRGGVHEEDLSRRFGIVRLSHCHPGPPNSPYEGRTKLRYGKRAHIGVDINEGEAAMSEAR